MKKYLKKIIVFCLLVIPFAVNAVTIKNPFGEGSTLWDIFSKIVNFMFVLSLPIAALMIVIAAFFFLTSMGDPEKVKRARQLILWAIVGVIVLFLSKAIVNLLLEAIGSEAKVK